jgi:mRNA interferase RelE/StbE
MQYRVELRPKVVKFLGTIPTVDSQRIQDRIKELSTNPRQDGVIKLSGKDPAQYRVRQGNYRILFTIFDELLLVEVIEINHRKDAYRI